eukprot:m.10289 g.10289  ORF g.10289 m.10289 type:complete len:53 (-) comp5972_c2_seq1:185-343(-)
MPVKQGASLVVYTMLALGSIGYAIEYPHLISEYKKNPPTWSKYYNKEAQQHH